MKHVTGFLVVLVEDESMFVRDMCREGVWVDHPEFGKVTPLGPPLFFVEERDALAYAIDEGKRSPGIFKVIPALLSYGA